MTPQESLLSDHPLPRGRLVRQPEVDFVFDERFVRLPQTGLDRLREALRQTRWNVDERHRKSSARRPAGRAAAAYGDWDRRRGITVADLRRRLLVLGVDVPSERSLARKLRGAERFDSALLTAIARELAVTNAELVGLTARPYPQHIAEGRDALVALHERHWEIAEFIAGVVCAARDDLCSLDDDRLAARLVESQHFANLVWSINEADPRLIKQLTENLPGLIDALLLLRARNAANAL